MADVDLILNSTGKVAVAKLQVYGFRIRQDGDVSLSVFLSTGTEVQFETAASMGELQPLVNDFVASVGE